MSRPIRSRGILSYEPSVYGYSTDRAPLQVWHPPQGNVELLVFAGIHGEEADSTILLSRALRSMTSHPTCCAVILCANPDGTRRGTRGNANGVDLNRNFPSTNWRPDPVRHKWAMDSDSEVELSPGKQPSSEPEVSSLVKLVGDLSPQCVVSVHSPLGLIDDPENTELGRVLAERSRLPRTALPTEYTPGSFGSWAENVGIPSITYELPNLSVWDMLDVHLPVLRTLLEKGLNMNDRPQP